jgi:nudix-type nucleoside diphosphatase (YffH/AdpP family)
MSVADRIRVQEVRLLSNNYGKLTNTTFQWRRDDGTWQTQQREVFERGNAAAILPYNLERRSVILVRQFRYPAYVSGHDDLLIEAAAGLLDDASPEQRIRLEAEEETGFRLHHVQFVFEAFMSPGVFTEKIHFFVAEYEPHMRVGAGGGLMHEGEEIEVLDVKLDDALAMISDGHIVDAKTIMLLQHAALKLFV